MSGKRKKHTPEFREQAARLVIETGRPVAHVAAEIGVGEQLLGRWVRLARDAADAGNTGAVLDADERAELERLRRENAELRLDREFLKKVFEKSIDGPGWAGAPDEMRIRRWWRSSVLRCCPGRADADHGGCWADADAAWCP
jgi:transposase